MRTQLIAAGLVALSIIYLSFFVSRMRLHTTRE